MFDLLLSCRLCPDAIIDVVLSFFNRWILPASPFRLCNILIFLIFSVLFLCCLLYFQKLDDFLNTFSGFPASSCTYIQPLASPVHLSTGLLLPFCLLPMQKACCKDQFCRLSGISFQNTNHQYMLLAALCFLRTGTKSPFPHKLLTGRSLTAPIKKQLGCLTAPFAGYNNREAKSNKTSECDHCETWRYLLCGPESCGRLGAGRCATGTYRAK